MVVSAPAVTNRHERASAIRMIVEEPPTEVSRAASRVPTRAQESQIERDLFQGAVAQVTQIFGKVKHPPSGYGRILVGRGRIRQGAGGLPQDSWIWDKRGVGRVW